MNGPLCENKPFNLADALSLAALIYRSILIIHESRKVVSLSLEEQLSRKLFAAFFSQLIRGK